MINRITLPSPATLRHLLALSLLALLGSVVSIAPLHAGVLFTFDQVGSDVVATTSGTIASGWTRDGGTGTWGNNGSFLRSDGIYGTQPGGLTFSATNALWSFNLMTDVPFNNTGTTTGDTFGYSGDSFTFGGSFIVPAGTSEGDAITPITTITWSNATYESLGLDTGLSTTPLVLFTLDNSETISAVRGELVPEPTSIAFLATGGLAAGVVAVARRRRRTGAGS